MSYKQQWDDYKIRSRFYWLAQIVFILSLAFGLPLVIVLHNDVLFYIYLFAVVGVGFALNVYGYYRSFWKCPHCHQNFFRRPGWSGTMVYAIFARHCKNCGLPKWAENDTPDENIKERR